jgi:hypothetical protein
MDDNGRQAYTAYADLMVARDIWLPHMVTPWHALSQNEQDAWRAAAEAAQESVRLTRLVQVGVSKGGTIGSP